MVSMSLDFVFVSFRHLVYTCAFIRYETFIMTCFFRHLVYTYISVSKAWCSQWEKIDLVSDYYSNSKIGGELNSIMMEEGKCCLGKMTQNFRYLILLKVDNMTGANLIFLNNVSKLIFLGALEKEFHSKCVHFYFFGGDLCIAQANLELLILLRFLRW